MRNTKFITQTAVIAALYASVSFVQAFLFPGSQSAAIQFRISEVLVVLAFFTPAALPGLTVGCALTNILSGFPLDILFGSMATLISCYAMRKTMHKKIAKIPLLSLLFPIVVNAIIVGAELQLFVIGKWNFLSFLLQALLVAAGEFGVVFALGIPFYFLIQKTKLHRTFKV